MDIDQQINFLKKIDFFDGFDDHELRQFIAVSKWLKVPKDKHIIKEDTMERVFYILVKGKVSVVKTLGPGGKTVELTTLGSGACFGEMSLVMDVKRTAGVITRSECFILMVEPGIINTSNVFLQLKFYKRFCEILVSRLIQANVKVAEHEKISNLENLKEVQLPKDEVHKEAINVSEIGYSPRNEPEETEDTQGTIMVIPPLPDKKDRIVRKKIHRKISAALDLPINPAVIAKLEPLLVGECDNTRLFTDILLTDPILSCKVIQIANSSFFRRSALVASVPHAMVTVGVRHFQEALTEVIEQVRYALPFQGIKQVSQSFWRHSVVVARIAVILKDVIRLNLSSDIYLAGLLHDIGVLVLDPIEPNFYPHLADKESVACTDLLNAENTYIGVDHGQAGAWFGECISLPTPYIEAMHFHHDLEHARENAIFAAIVNLADIFATNHGCGLGCCQRAQIDPHESFGWIIIQDNHPPFLEVNIASFIATFNEELTKTWSSITSGLP
jgi:HD-like signal output (HDOD) protein/CRP-like cAMP-binding protein